MAVAPGTDRVVGIIEVSSQADQASTQPSRTSSVRIREFEAVGIGYCTSLAELIDVVLLMKRWEACIVATVGTAREGHCDAVFINGVFYVHAGCSKGPI